MINLKRSKLKQSKEIQILLNLVLPMKISLGRLIVFASSRMEVLVLKSEYKYLEQLVPSDKLIKIRVLRSISAGRICLSRQIFNSAAKKELKIVYKR